jgi:hypothetical protein
MEEKKTRKRIKNTSVTCPDCGTKETPGPEVKRIRNRLCQNCVYKRRRKKRLDDPVTRLQSKTRSLFFYRNYSNKELWSRETISALYEKYDGKCVLTGATDVSQLSFVSLRPVPDGENPSIDNLVLVCNTKAAEIEKTLDTHLRRAFFPPEALIKIGFI